MIDLKRLRQDPEGSRASLLRRRDPSVGPLLDAILELDRRRRELLVRVEALKAERNAASEEVARRKRAKEPADELMARLKASGEEVKALDARAARDRGRARPARARAPQLSRRRDARRRRDRQPGRPHLGRAAPRSTSRRGRTGSWARRSGILDLPAGAKIAGSGFPLLRGLGARLVRRARRLHARPAHAGARLRGGGAALPGEPGDA